MLPLWRKISPQDFEEFCAVLLELEKFSNVSWLGAAGGDKARDILADKIVEPVSGKKQVEKWVIQCKRYSKKKLAKSELHALFASTEEHAPNNLLLIYTSSLGPNLTDWIDSVKRNYSFGIYILQISDLERLVQKHGFDLAKRLPKLFQKQGKGYFYEMSPPDEHFFACNDSRFDEVFITIWNSGTYTHARRRLEEFIDYVKSNKFSVSTKPSKRG